MSLRLTFGGNWKVTAAPQVTQCMSSVLGAYRPSANGGGAVAGIDGNGAPHLPCGMGRHDSRALLTLPSMEESGPSGVHSAFFNTVDHACMTADDEQQRDSMPCAVEEVGFIGVWGSQMGKPPSTTGTDRAVSAEGGLRRTCVGCSGVGTGGEQKGFGVSKVDDEESEGAGWGVAASREGSPVLTSVDAHFSSAVK